MLLFQKIAPVLNSFLLRLVTTFQTHPFESLFGLPLVLFYGWYVLALTGLFYSFFVIFIFLAVAIGVITLISKKPAFCNVQNATLLVFLCFFAILAITTHPVELVAEGRDQGTFITSALLLQDHNGFSFTLPEAKPFFELYGPGKALNFPGLAYTQEGALVPEFPLGYIIWLSGFVSIFGLLGFTLANVGLYIWSGMLFYTLAKRVTEPFWSFVGTLVVMGGFLPLWFLSFTLSENLALFLFLLIAECALRFQINKDRLTLLLAFASVFALALTRIEGWAIAVMLVLILSYKKSRGWWSQIFTSQKSLFTFSALFALVLAGWTLWINAPYYKAMAKALLKSADQSIAITTLGEETFPLYRVLLEYGLFLPFVFGLIAALYFWKTRRFHLLIPFLLALPTLPYLLLPHITLDAPWMLRRFLFSLYPALLLSALWGMSLLIRRSQIQKPIWGWALFFGIILGGQIAALQHFTETRYSQTLLPQVENFAAPFSSDDLLLIDKDVTGDNFMIPARSFSLLFGKPAVYFFNPDDLAKIDTTGFTRVILLTPQQKLPTYIDDMGLSLSLLDQFTFINDHSFRTTDFEQSTLPKKELKTTSVVVLEIY